MAGKNPDIAVTVKGLKEKLDCPFENAHCFDDVYGHEEAVEAANEAAKLLKQAPIPEKKASGKAAT